MSGQNFPAESFLHPDVEARSILDGHLLWQVPNGIAFVSLVADGGTLYLEIQQGEVDARQVVDGKLLWQRQEAGGEMFLSKEDHLLYLVGRDSGEVLTLDPASGASRWHVVLGNSLSGFLAASFIGEKQAGPPSSSALSKTEVAKIPFTERKSEKIQPLNSFFMLYSMALTTAERGRRGYTTKSGQAQKRG